MSRRKAKDEATGALARCFLVSWKGERRHADEGGQVYYEGVSLRVEVRGLAA